MFLSAGCQQLPISTGPASNEPVTVRGAQPALESSPTPGAFTATKTESPRASPVKAKVIPVAASSSPSDAGDALDSLFSDNPAGARADSETRSIFEPGFAGGLSLPIDQRPPVISIECTTDEPANADGAGGVFGSGADGDDPPFGYPDGVPVEQTDPPLSFMNDIRGLPSMLWNDAKSIVTWPNVVVLGAAAAGAVAIRDNLDHRVRDYTAESPLRWGEGSVVLRQFGEYSYQVPFLAGVYALGLWTENDRLHEFSVAAFSAYGLTAISTVAIKGVTDTTRPTTQFQNGHYGFPSYHAASTFTLAAVIEEYYGWQLGLPAYALSGLVGWSRIDQREHDLSDVFFGSVLGLVIGKTVAAAHLDRRANMKITPYYDAQNRTSGVSFEKRY